ncbi:MAG TPA: helicase-related protein, partial [Symbiobacteriaceae bacterium]|nr:helicase-related protein [Symbiobacteriaceae bacterium]
PPALCTCGASKFHWGALLDPTRVIRSGSRDWLPGRTTQRGTPSEVSYDTYKLMTPVGLLVNVSDGGRHLMPCQHPYTRWNKKRFNHMIRTPENILATSSQIQLRTHLRDSALPLAERLKQAKMLTFSDSHRDMENVNRNFNEPERRHFLAASAFTVLQLRGRLTLSELLAETVAEVERFGAVVHGAKHAGNIYRDLVPGRRAMAVRQRLVREEIAALVRQLDHRTTPVLVADGVAGLELDGALLNALNGEARTVLGRFWEELMGRRANRVYADKDWTPAQVSLLRSLEARGLLVREDERLYLAPDALLVTLVGPDHPGLWSPQSNTFHPEIAVQLGCRQARGLVRYRVPLQERSDPGSRFFSLAVYELTYSPPALLASRVYKGDTSKEERRETEHVFKTKASLHHISSGPAMEVGIDIGALNALALYGTPPNTNGYLQRVGRAGRRSKRSLIVTVSKSNPIDFYYYRWPHKLIGAEPQPVPLTDQNREVLRISLTWAVLDYIACHYWVPWVDAEVAAGGETRKVVKSSGMPTTVFAPPAAEYHRFSRVLFTEVDRLANGDALNVLSHQLSADQAEVRQWLADLLNGIVSDPVETESIIDSVISGFAANVYGFVKEILTELNKRVRTLEKERLGLIETLEDDLTLSDEARMSLEMRRTQIQSEVSQFESLREEMKQAKLMELQQISRRKRYAYSLRSVSNVVEVHRRGPAGEDEDGAIVTEALPARDLAMGLTEYHPAAMVLREEAKHVVTHLFPEQFETARLHDKLGKLRSVCANCGTLMDEGASVCTSCGSADVQVAHLVVPGRVVIAPATQKLHENPAQQMPIFTAQMIYRTADDQDKIHKTFAITQEEGALVDGAARETICLTDEGLVAGPAPDGAVVQALFTFAPVEMVTYVPAYSAQFEGGRREQVSLFRMCGVEDCGGVGRMGAQPPFCTHDPTHDLSRARYIVPTRQFATRGIKVVVLVGDREQALRVAHTLAHGLRMALQQLAGVDLRTLGEVADGDGYLVYEDVEGGYGITDLLLRQDDQGSLVNMKQALELIRDHTSGAACQCDDGCPFCLYQYGCTHRNRPGSLTRRGLHHLLDRPL